MHQKKTKLKENIFKYLTLQSASNFKNDRPLLLSEEAWASKLSRPIFDLRVDAGINAEPTESKQLPFTHQDEFAGSDENHMVSAWFRMEW